MKSLDTTQSREAELLERILEELSRAQQLDIPSDIFEHHPRRLEAAAGSFTLDIHRPVGYLYIPNTPRDLTINWGIGSAQLIETLDTGQTLSLEIPRAEQFTISFTAGTVATLDIYVSSRPIRSMKFADKVVGVSGTVNIGAQGTPFDVANGNTDTQSPALNALPVVGYNFLLNEITNVWERQRGNSGRVLLASAARSTDTATADQTNESERGLLLFLNVTANPGGAEVLQVSIQARMASISTYKTYALFPTIAAATNDTYLYFIYPGAIETILAAGVEVQGLPVPRVWRAFVDHSGAGSWTYQLDGMMAL